MWKAEFVLPWFITAPNTGAVDQSLPFPFPSHGVDLRMKAQEFSWFMLTKAGVQLIYSFVLFSMKPIPLFLFCSDSHVSQTWAHGLCVCVHTCSSHTTCTCSTLLALLRLEDALKKMILFFVLLLQRDITGCWAGSGWWGVANTDTLVKAWKKGLFLSHCYFHARHCSLVRKIRRYALNSVKYAEAVDVYSPCRIIH